MSELTNLKTAKYKQMNYEIFKDYIAEGIKMIIEIEDNQNSGFRIVSVNGCESPEAFKERLFIKIKSALNKLDKELEKLDTAEKVDYLEYIAMQADKF